MIRRDFIKGSLAAMAALSTPLLGSESKYSKKIFLISELDNDGDYLKDIQKRKNTRDSIIVLNKDITKNLSTISKTIEQNKNSLICGVLKNSDYVILQHTVALQKSTYLSEVFHTISNNGISHSENSYSNISLKEAFREFGNTKMENFENIISVYHSLDLNIATNNLKRNQFTSKHKTKYTLVSFVLKA